MKLFFIIQFLLFGSNFIDGYKILLIAQLPSKSHHNLDTGIADTLAEAGHEVTIISPFSRKKSQCTEIAIPEILAFKESIPAVGFEMGKASTLKLMLIISQLQQKMGELFYENLKIQKFMADESQTFDLVILEYYSDEFTTGFAVKYDCPIIVVSPTSMTSLLAGTIGNPYSWAIVPNAFVGISSTKTLFDRVNNFLANIVHLLMDKFYLNPIHEKLYEKYFPAESKKESYAESKNRIKLMFMNTHPSMEIARPLLPNVIEIGGFHINEPEPLPQDLQDIMDSAKYGVIYFSLGSVVNATEMDQNMKTSLLKAFSKLKQIVLWKFEEDIPEKSDNIKIRKWMPQNSILAHSNLKLFMTHGGLLSCTEAVHFAVPLIVIPVFADQYHNAQMVVDRGQGLKIDMNNITDSSLDWALNEVLSNRRFYESAIWTQKLYADRPIKSRDLIKFYVDHVIRTDGADHLSPPKISRWSLLLLDVLAVIFIPIMIIIYISIVCCRRVLDKRNVTLINTDKKYR